MSKEESAAGASRNDVRNDDIMARQMLMFAEDTIPKFSGQDKSYPATRWTQDMDDHAEIFEWTPLQRLVIARRTLTGTAALWLRSERPFKSWTDLKAAILREFPDTLDQKAIHEMMGARKKKPNETYLDYMLVMKEMGKRGKMADYIAIKYIVDGIPDNEMNKLSLYGVTTYSDLKEKLKIYETVKSKMKSVHAQQPSSHSKEVRCYNCGEKNHRSSDCPRKRDGLKCFKCNSFGHIASACNKSHKEIQYEGGGRTGQYHRKYDDGASRGRFGRDRHAEDYREQPIVDERRRYYQRSGGETIEKRAMFGADCDDEVGGTASGTNMAVEVGGDGDIDSRCQRNVNKQRSEGFSTKPIVGILLLNKVNVDALVDTGSDVNLMEQCVYDEIKWCVKCDNEDFSLTGLGLYKVKSIGRCVVSLTVDDKVADVLFHVIPNGNMPYRVILGQEFLSKYTVVFNGDSIHFLSKGENWIRKLDVGANCDFVVGNTCSPRVQEEVMKCVESYQPMKTKEAPLELKIVLKDDVPVRHRPRRLSLMEQQIVEKQIAEWLEDGIIRVSYSEYTSPLVLVKKKDGSTRVCVDYRDINKKMVKDEYPLPIIEDLIDRLRDAKFFSVLDLKNGFFHLKVSAESIKYTSFVIQNAQYEFLRAPFGLSICPKYFTRFITIIFRELTTQGYMSIFIDDLIVYAEDEFQALERLKNVLKVASDYGLQINWKKANLICHRVEYLGHLVEDGKVRPSPDKTDAVMRFPEPTTFKQVHSFVGLTSYFRKYIPNYAVIAKPLTDLLRKEAVFVFDNAQRKAFNELKQRLVSSPVLSLFNPRFATELHTDASSIAYAAILMQRDGNGELHPVYYMSRRTTEAESKYSSYELEALAIIAGVKKFHHYLFGIRFKIVTDCQAFKMTLNKKDLSPRVARWVLFLDQYDYEIEHRPGSRMQHTDALSRNPYTAVMVSLHDEIRRAQDLDEGLVAIKNILHEKPYSDYIIENGLLYKGMEKQLVIPRGMELEIIRRIHERGHFSKKKMVELIGKDYFIKNLNKKIDDFLLTCIPCLLATRKEGRQEGFLNPIDKYDTPLHTLHCDHIGPLTQTKKQYNYILTVVDGFSKFVWIFPTKGTTTTETLNKLRVHQQTFGNPNRIITDRGTSFTSNDFKEYCETEKIQHVTITTGIARSNGQVERIHRVIVSILTKLCIADQTQWYRHVSRLQRALNSTFQRSIKMTPFELLMGTRMRTREDIEIYQLLEQEKIEDHMQQREDLRQTAKEHIVKIQEENSKQYNKKRKESIKYKEGDRVAIKRTQFGPCLKLKEKFLGPYLVTKCKRNDRYDVSKIDESREGPIKTSTSADFMKPWPEYEASVGE